MLSVGVVGSSNVGKTTFLNALLGQSLLPSKHVASTAILTHCFLDGGVPEGEEAGESYLLEDGKAIKGRAAVRRNIKEANDQVRSSEAGLVDKVVHTGACPRLKGICDGTVRLTDVPGHNESDLPVVKECKRIVAAFCHVVFILVRHGDVRSESVVQLVSSLINEAEHLFHAQRDQRNTIIFVVTQVDTLDANQLDSESEEEGAGAIDSLKSGLRDLLRAQAMLERFPWFAETVPIHAIGVTRGVIAGETYPYDWPCLLDTLEDMHRDRLALIDGRKIHNAAQICKVFDPFVELPELTSAYPFFSEQVVDETRRLQKRNLAIASLGLGTIVLGGWLGLAAWGFRATALAEAAAATSTAAAASQTVATASAAAAAAEATAAAASSSAATIGGMTGLVTQVVSTICGLGIAESAAVSTSIGVVADGVGFVALGGAAAAEAAASATATAAAASSLAATAAATATSMTSAAAGFASTAYAAAAASAGAAVVTGGAVIIGGKLQVTAPGVGALGAQAAVKEVQQPSIQQIRDSEGTDGVPYKDIWLWPATEDRILYVGEFRGRLPHGSGRLFWKCSQLESVIGRFEEGRLVHGTFINKLGMPIGSLRCEQAPDGSRTFSVHGYQPDQLFDPSEPCAICLENPTLLSEGYVMNPCMHGCVCSSCFRQLELCPVCRVAVTGKQII